ncbi:hypothetical protein [Streptomyces werraensis]
MKDEHREVQVVVLGRGFRAVWPYNASRQAKSIVHYARVIPERIRTPSYVMRLIVLSSYHSAEGIDLGDYQECVIDYIFRGVSIAGSSRRHPETRERRVIGVIGKGQRAVSGFTSFEYAPVLVVVFIAITTAVRIDPGNYPHAVVILEPQLQTIRPVYLREIAAGIDEPPDERIVTALCATDEMETGKPTLFGGEPKVVPP